MKATFNGPKELAVDQAGNIWIVDTENHAIRCIDAATKQIRTVAGTGKPARMATADRRQRPDSTDPTASRSGLTARCWIADTNNHRIRRVPFGPLRRRSTFEESRRHKSPRA